MKRTIITITILCILLAGICCVPASAAGATLSLSSNTLRAGDSFSVTLTVSMNGALTVDGAFSYSGPVSLTSVSGKLGTLDRNGNNIFIDLGNSAVTGAKAVAVANFKVNASANPGENISVSFSGNYSNLDGDFSVSGSVSKQLAAPLSGNCDLMSLTVTNAQISPGFNGNTTAYSAGEVPFSVSSLDIKAVAEDAKAKVTVSGNQLSVGSNTVTVTVKAENGATKAYKISVLRQQDPNYVPSSNTSLAGIAVDGFLISPPFSADVDTYVVWLPYETENISVTATPVDGKATVSVVGGTGLQQGDNEILISCTAEDGSKKEYCVIAKRAIQNGNQTEQETQPETEATEEPTVPTSQPKPVEKGVELSVVVISCIMAFSFGAGLTVLLMKFRKAKR